MKIKLISIVSLLLVIVTLAGCSKKEKNDSETTGDIGTTMRLNKLDMTLDNVVSSNSQLDSEDNQMLIVEMSITNTAKEELPVGANDFKVIGKDKKAYEIYGLEPDNFGQVLKSGETLTGKAYYEIPSSLNKGKLVFKPKKEIVGEWEIKIPAIKQTK